MKNNCSAPLDSSSFDISLSGLSNGWQGCLVPETQGDITILHLILERETPAEPPKVSLEWRLPCTDIAICWTSAAGFNRHLFPTWYSLFSSNLASQSPMFSLISSSSANRLTIAFSEALREVVFRGNILEKGSLILAKISLFNQPEAPISRYDAYLRLDTRPIFYSDAISDAAHWFETFPEYAVSPIPAGAFEPLYSTWYSYHQNLQDTILEKECDTAKNMEMKTIIVDDGWQTDDNNGGYAFCGDWAVSRRRFPDMAEHVKKIHAMGMKYILWYSVPFIGYKSDAYKTFIGKYLFNIDHLKTSVLDPRFPEVREYLINIYEQAIKDWDIDGFKLDFIDSFRFDGGHDPAVKENYAGRDIKNLPLAVDALLTEATRRLKCLKPDILIEFRQAYIGPAVRKYGNMLRVHDCPNDYLTNRVGSIDLRISSGQTAIHSDMLEWHPTEKVEHAALYMLNVLFAVPQISVCLNEIPESHRKMIDFWLKFWTQHRETLMHGHLTPYSPELFYPLISAEGKNENVLAVYNPLQLVPIRQISTSLVNATPASEITVELPAAPSCITIYDCQGTIMESSAIHLSAGLAKLPVPPSGLAVLEF